MDKMDLDELNATIKRYDLRFKQFGYSPKSLGWLKGKQEIRFMNLLSEYNVNNKHILDIGCGFGDLNTVLSKVAHKYQYTGCDLYDNFIAEGKIKYPNGIFKCGDFLSLELKDDYDWAVASGPFNHIFEKKDNYDFIQSVMSKTLDIVKDGFSFDFISDRVDYRDEHIFYANSEKILSMAYDFSRNVILKNNYMPFEFSIFVYKDDSFNDNNVFNSFLHNENF